MLAKGRGEILQRLPDLPLLSVVLAKPPVSVSTAWAYKTYDRIGTASHPDTKSMLTALFEGSVEKVARGLVNVLEVVTMREYPAISTYKRVLMENGALASLMSGSGPTVFGLAESRENAEKAAQALSRAYPDAAVFVAPTTGKNLI
jgi:4-diphosphocytidyl-2-C-methyl-D-erythritol kinase